MAWQRSHGWINAENSECAAFIRGDFHQASACFGISTRGDKLFRDVCTRKYNGKFVHLLHDDLYNPNASYAKEIQDLWRNLGHGESYCGALGRTDTEDELVSISDFTELDNGANLHLTDHDYAITECKITLFNIFDMMMRKRMAALLTLANYTVAVCASESSLLLLDSHSRNERGYPTPDGRAVLLQFASSDKLILYLRKCYSTDSIVYLDMSLFSCIVANDTGQSTSKQSRRHARSKSGAETVDIVEKRRKVRKTKCDDTTVSFVCNTDVNTVSGNTIVNTLENTVINSEAETERFIGSNSINDAIQRQHDDMTSNALSVHTDNDMHVDEEYDIANSSTETDNAQVPEIIQRLKEYNEKAIEKRESRNTSHMSAFEKRISILFNRVCEVCGRLLFDDSVKQIRLNEDHIHFMTGYSCSDVLHVCGRCQVAITKKTLPSRVQINKLNLDDIPDVLRNLTILERCFIAKINCFHTLVVLPFGQLAQQVMTVYIPNELNAVLEELPLRVNPGGIICVSQAKRDCNVYHYIRWPVVLAALIWLRRNNQLYTDVNIQADIRAFVPYVRNVVENLEETGMCDRNVQMPDIDASEYIQKSGCQVYDLAWNDQRPIVFTEHAHGEALAFPWLFPKGGDDLSTKRDTPLTVRDYFQSRLLHFDTRFRTDQSYIFIACNLIELRQLFQTVNVHVKMRKSVPSSTHTSVAGNSEAVTAGDLQNMDDTSDIAVNSYMFTKDIRGTPAYWKDELYNLLATVRAIGVPDVFMMLSADDLHWPELQEMILEEQKRNNANSQTESNIRCHPILAAMHFDRRWKALLYEVLLKGEQPLGKIKDFFHRTEFQNRGSAHLHMFFWLENAPSFAKNSNVEELRKYIDKIISTVLPDKELDPELHDLVKRLQTHNHTSSCSRPTGCRFDFPCSESNETRILYTGENTSCRKSRFYETKRPVDSTFINANNPTILQHWKANMDIQMVSGLPGLAYYVCKYVLKTKPDSLKQAIAAVSNELRSATNLDKKHAMVKLGMAVLKSRQLSAQEAAFRATRLNLVGSSRKVVYVNTSPPSARYKLLKPWNELLSLEESSTDVFQEGSLEYYRKRPEELAFMSYFRVLSEFTILKTKDGTRFRPRKKSACIRGTYMTPVSDNYFYAMLLLHLPHRTENELLNGYSNARDAYLAKHTLFDMKELINESYLQEVIASAQRVRLICAALEGEENNSIMEERTSNNVSEQIVAYAQTSDQLRDDYVTDNEPQTHSLTAADNDWHHLLVCRPESVDLSDRIAQLNRDQRAAFDEVVQHVKSQQLLFITGEAGSGKSFLLRIIVDWLRQTQCAVPGLDCVAFCAPTGIAAKNIQGTTIHSLLRLPVQHGSQPTYIPLSAKALKFICTTFNSLKFIIIDEISMVSKKMLKAIHDRLCQIANNSELFGNYTVIACGDFFQLPPIRDAYAFQESTLWSNFKCVYLSQNVRQENDNVFASLLNTVRVGYISQDQIALLKTRIMEDKYAMPDVVRLFPTIRLTNAYNEHRQQTLSDDALLIPSEDVYSQFDYYSGCLVLRESLPTTERETGGLLANLRISKGTRVMLIKNLGDGLVNGSMGIVTSFEFKPILNNRREVHYIYIEFDDPESGGRWKTQANTNCVRLEKYPQEFIHKGRHILRIQFPILPAWAISIHKSQGLTLEKAVVSLGKQLFANGQAYVALSHVRSLEGLYLTDFAVERIKCDMRVLQFYAELRQKYLRK